MDGLLGRNRIGSGESIFYGLVQRVFAAFALGLIADLCDEFLRFSLRFGLRHFRWISNISAVAKELDLEAFGPITDAAAATSPFAPGVRLDASG
jgi:hypothetical protein